MCQRVRCYEPGELRPLERTLIINLKLVLIILTTKHVLFKANLKNRFEKSSMLLKHLLIDIEIKANQKCYCKNLLV